MNGKFKEINMNGVAKVKIVFFILALLCLGSGIYAVNEEQQSSEPLSDESIAQPEQKKDTDVEKIQDRREEAAKAKREAEDKAKWEAAEIAKAKLEEEIEKLNLPEDKTQRFNVKEVQISGNSLISTDELLADMPLVYNASDKPLHQAESGDLYDLRIFHEIIQQPGQERQVSSRMIQGFTRYILSAYQQRNYAGIYVYVPAEAIKDKVELRDGILPVKVLELCITEITINYFDPDKNKVEKGYLRESAVYNWSPVKVGQVAEQKKLDDFINLLNLNPDRYVSAAVTRGTEPNSLAVGYDIYEANPWHFFIQLDNGGTKDREWTPRVGLVNTNLLGIDDALTVIYQAPWERGMEEEYSVYGSYDIPLFTPRARLNVYAGYSQFDIAKDASGIGFIGNGSFVGGTLRYNVFQTQGWFFDVTGSLGSEISRITPTLFPTMASDVSMELWGVGANVHRSDDMSSTSFSFNRLENFGGSTQSDFWNPVSGTGARTNAERDFSIYTTTAAHSRFLDPNKIGRISGTFRWITSEERLVPAKMTTFGGMYTVRGYEEYEIVADGGVLASVRRVAPLTFFDYGRARNVAHVAGERSEQTICSVGIGTLVDLGDNFSGAVYYGWPLIGTDDTSKGRGRLNLGFLLRW
jgi:hemolysin activation/secretion protein